MDVNNYNFERVVNFKFLMVGINENSDSHEEIRLRSCGKAGFRKDAWSLVVNNGEELAQDRD